MNNNNYELKNFTLNDVIGQEEATQEIRDLLALKSDPEIANYWKVPAPKGILFVGPPGTGKTMTVRAMVNESENFQLIEIGYQDIASKWLNEGIETLSKFFALIETAAKVDPVIVFVDEIDSILPSRNANNLHQSYVQMVNTFIQWMDGGLDSLENVTIIGATNNFEKLDKAAVRPGRFDRIITFKELDASGIVKLFQNELSKRKYDKAQVSEIDWAKIKSELEGNPLSGAVAGSIITNISKKKMTEHYQNFNKPNEYSKSVPTNVIMKLEDMMPSPISTQDIIDSISRLKN